MEQWENNYYISAIAGATNGSSLVVMSKGLSQLFFCWRSLMLLPLLFFIKDHLCLETWPVSLSIHFAGVSIFFGKMVDMS